MKNLIGKAFTQNIQTTSSWYVRDAKARQCLDLLFQQDLAKSVPIFYIGSDALATCKQAPTNLPIGLKQYELTNHLGNVLSTISDFKVPVDIGNNGSTDYFTATVISQQSYYPLGMLMPERKFSVTNGNYRFGFNGKENDNEVKGIGNQQDYGMRIYDPRLGKFLSVDPLTASYPMLTPYQFASNRPIDGIDIDGLEYAPADYLNKLVNAGTTLIKKATVEVVKSAVNYLFGYHPTRNDAGNPVVDNIIQAAEHYYRGGGEDVVLGPNPQE